MFHAHTVPLYARIWMSSVDAQLLLWQIQKSYMFWLHKAAIIRPHLSENTKRKLYNPSHTFDYKMYV